jgi:hypothetical protein
VKGHVNRATAASSKHTSSAKSISANSINKSQRESIEVIEEQKKFKMKEEYDFYDM